MTTYTPNPLPDTYLDDPTTPPDSLPEWHGDTPYISDATANALAEALGMDYVIITTPAPAVESEPK